MKNYFDEIVFLHKNREYGAYLMRKRYTRTLANSLLMALIIFLTVSVYLFIVSPNAFQQADEDLNEEIAAYEQYTFLKEMDTLRISTVPPKKKNNPAVLQQPVVVDSLEKTIDTVRTIKTPDLKADSNQLDTLALSDSARAGTLNGLEDGSFFMKVDNLPEFPGGNKARLQFIIAALKYPDEALKKKLGGIVEIQFVVESDGSVDKISVKKGIDPLLDNEAVRIVKLFPKWRPAKRYGQPVRFMMVQVFNFQPYTQ